ncbi:hypothetical protein O7623_27625 [Solwaraspora sp. WMMD791]|uniref:hypothetical protein n=1 Tax=Solwaraspora sp. WMMD791 TaxID=3016086 RepID=UPI00249BF5D6|nr:hypothetical protein [Solwaraspora sp. WMMD791]WFE26987.1 hypothetical protein O7623_27625 [Solwaraspora sp. WMMD791]
MSLAVTVGITTALSGIDDEGAARSRAALDELSTALTAEGVAWQEPYEVAVPSTRPHLRGFPTVGLHQLRRVLALVDAATPVTPVTDAGGLAADRELIDDQAALLESHLLCHSDSAGYYVPVDFGDPLFLPAETGVAGGGIVGSSQGLLAELRRCAGALGVRLDPAGDLPDTEAARLFALPDDADYAVETQTWLTLHEACRASIASGRAIVFH